MRARLVLLFAACHPAADVPSDTDTDGLPLAPVATCEVGDACAAAPADGAFSAWRKDVFYPYGPGVLGDAPFGTDDAPAYPEAGIADPVDGGRLVVVGRAAVAGALVESPVPDGDWRRAWSVELDGVPAHELLDDRTLDWVRVGPETFVAGDPIWVTLHTREAWDADGSVRVVVPSTGGTALDVEVPVATSPVRLTSVAFTEDLATMRIHVRNEDDVPHDVARVIVDGEDVTDASCLPTRTLAPRTSLMITVPRCAPAALGDAWTVALDLDDVGDAVGAGRVIKPVFPIHTWPTERDCPFPGIRDDAFQAYLDQGYDTLFARAGYGDDGCAPRSTVEAIQSSAFAEAGAWAMPDDFGMRFDDTTRVLARLLGDEVDNASLERLVDEGKMRRMADNTAYWAHEEPEVATYIGASRHRFTGMFAGAADIQGMDMYVAACAPHITDFGVHPPLRASYDYLRATHANQAPLPTWLYTQGFGSWPGQPTPSEYRVQALSVVAAGAKGLMTFQTKLDVAAEHPATWDEMGRLNRDLRALRPWLREGDPTGMARVTSGRGLVEALRVPGGLVLVAIGLETTQGPSDLECALATDTPWVLADQALDVEVDLPPDLGVVDVFEVLDGALVAAPASLSASDRTLRLAGIPLDDVVAGRLIVIASDPGLRDEVAARLP